MSEENNENKGEVKAGEGAAETVAPTADQPNAEAAAPEADAGTEAQPKNAEAPKDEHNDAAPSEDGQPKAEQPADQAETPAAEATPKEEKPKSEQKPAESEAVKEAKKHLKITVSTKPKAKKFPKGSFAPNDAAAKRAWINQKHKEQQESLIRNGYTPTAAIAIMRYLTNNHGYEKQRAKDHLIYMFEHLSRSMRFSLNIFTRDISSQLAVLLCDVAGHLSEERNLLNMKAEESMQFVLNVFDSVWKSSGGNSTREMQALKNHFEKAMNVKVAEGYAARARYFIECIVDTTMKMVDPFEGLFHTERLEVPDDVRKIMHMPPKGSEPQRGPRGQKNFNRPKREYPKVFCEKCGQEMKWIFTMKKHICQNPLCTEYTELPKRDFGTKNRFPKKRAPQQAAQPQNVPEKISKEHQTGYDSGKPIEQESAAAKFRRRFHGQITANPKKTVNGKTVAKRFETEGNPFAVLDQLKAPANKEPEAPKAEQLPKPPTEVPVPDAGTPGSSAGGEGTVTPTKTDQKEIPPATTVSSETK